MSVIVRTGTPDDVAAAYEVWNAAITSRRGSPPTPAATQRVRHRLSTGSGLFLVAADDEDVVGMAWGTEARSAGGAGEVIPGRFHLSLVFVRPDKWGHGIGGQLTDAVLARAAAEGFDTVELWTHEDNTRGNALYAARGFTRTDVVNRDEEGGEMWLWVRSPDRAARPKRRPPK